MFDVATGYAGIVTGVHGVVVHDCHVNIRYDADIVAMVVCIFGVVMECYACVIVDDTVDIGDGGSVYGAY